jgi:hypothetical protein
MLINYLYHVLCSRKVACSMFFGPSRPFREPLIMYFIVDMYYTQCHFDIFTLTWYMHEQTLHILSLMVRNHSLESFKHIFFH